MADWGPLESLAEINPRSPAARTGESVSFVAMADVSERGFLENVHVRSASPGYTSFVEGDVLLAKITPCMENGKGAHVRRLPIPKGQGSTEFHVLRARPGTSDRFLYHLTRTEFFRLSAEALMTGSAGQRRVPTEFFSKYAVRVPPLKEQRRIAEILDTVDETIQATERVIAKMELRAVGLMRRSFGGTTWQSGLETASVGSLLRNRPKNGKSPVESPVWNGAFVLGLGCLKAGGFSPEQLKFAPELDSFLSSALLSDGDLLISRSNTLDRVGFVGRYQDVGAPCIYPDLMMRLSVGVDASSRFLELALQSEPARRQIEAAASGTSGSMVKITGSTVTGLKVPLLPLDDQIAIADVFDEHGAAIAEERRTVAKIRQLRSGLASDLLSGRVRTVST